MKCRSNLFTIDLKLCDEHLRAFSGRADDDNALFDGTLENEDEPLLVRR
jgi:hypothetical protein